MRHCCKFSADDIYYLKDNMFYSDRKLAVGFCPICSKPVAEMTEYRFDGKIRHFTLVGRRANDYVVSVQKEILYSLKECNYRAIKGKPFGWRYGINREVKTNNKFVIKQYAKDFYGNKELVKIVG